MGWLKSFSIVPFWLHVSFITGSSSSLFPWMTLRLKRCVLCFVEDPMWSVLSDPPTLGSTARDNRLEKKLPFLCWVYKHLFSFFFLFFSRTVLPKKLLQWKLERKQKTFCWGFGSSAHAISAPSARWAPAPMFWSPRVSVRPPRSFIYVPSKCHSAVFPERLRLSWCLPHLFGTSLYCVLSQPFSILPTAIKLWLLSLSFRIH